MGIVRLKRPIEDIRGILKKNDQYYVRMLHGQCVVQKRPICHSEKQLAMRQGFGERWNGRCRKREGEVPVKSR